MGIIENAKIAKDIWLQLSDGDQHKLRQHFHLRPTNSGITIVTTIPSFPMRGIKCKKNDLMNKLMEIIDKLPKIYSTDEDMIEDVMKAIGFNKRNKNADTLEEDIQALMIRNMSKDKHLKDILKCQNYIQFIASELIFEKGNNRIDIVGYDGFDLYLFELKKGRTTKVDQVSNYVKYYSQKDKREILSKILKHYPNKSIDSFNEIHGVMIMQYAENSQEAIWKKLEKDFAIRILFFEKSLSYK